MFSEDTFYSLVVIERCSYVKIYWYFFKSYSLFNKTYRQILKRIRLINMCYSGSYYICQKFG